MGRIVKRNIRQNPGFTYEFDEVSDTPKVGGSQYLTDPHGRPIFPQRWLQGAMDYFQKGDTLNTFITENYELAGRLIEDLEIGAMKKGQKWTKETTKLARSHKWVNKAIQLDEILELYDTFWKPEMGRKAKSAEIVSAFQALGYMFDPHTSPALFRGIVQSEKEDEDCQAGSDSDDDDDGGGVGDISKDVTEFDPATEFAGVAINTLNLSITTFCTTSFRRGAV